MSNKLVKERTKKVMSLASQLGTLTSYVKTVVDSFDEANKSLDILDLIRVEVDELGKDKDKFSEIEWSFIDKSRSNIIIKIAQAIEFISEGYSKKYYIDGLVDNQGSQDGNSDTTLYYNLMSDKGCSLEAQLAFLEGIVRMLFVMFPGGVPLDKDETIAGNIKEIISNVNVSYDNINQKHGLKKLSGIGSVGSICDDRWDPLSRCKVTLS